MLCKSVDDSGITFFTNYDSAKGAELAATPYASATFPWFLLGRQVHVRGPVTKVSAEETADYWRHRPRGSQLGAWASHQSQPDRVAGGAARPIGRRHQRFADLDEVPVPPNWGGYLIAPEVVEFWQGRENRVHNRIRVTGRPHRAASTLVRRFFADTTPLRTPDFRRLWLAGIVTVIGANLTIFAVPVQLYALTQNSAYVGLSGIFALVPLVVFGLWGGALADAMDRRVLLIITSCGLAVASVSAVGAGRACAQQRLGGAVPASVQQAFFAINQPTRVGGDPADAARRSTACGQLAEHDGDAVRRHCRAAAGGGDAALGRPVDAVSDRRDHLRRPDLGDVPAAPIPPTDGERGSRVGDFARCWTGSAIWQATRWC